MQKAAVDRKKCTDKSNGPPCLVDINRILTELEELQKMERRAILALKEPEIKAAGDDIEALLKSLSAIIFNCHPELAGVKGALAEELVRLRRNREENLNLLNRAAEQTAAQREKAAQSKKALSAYYLPGETRELFLKKNC